jgi:hypothetical protein
MSLTSYRNAYVRKHEEYSSDRIIDFCSEMRERRFQIMKKKREELTRYAKPKCR